MEIWIIEVLLYFEYAPYNYNRDRNCLQRLCQHFLKTSFPCLPLHIRTYKAKGTITICDLSSDAAP